MSKDFNYEWRANETARRMRGVNEYKAEEMKCEWRIEIKYSRGQLI